VNLSDDQRSAVERIVGARVLDDVLLQDRAHILRVKLDDGRAVIVKRLRPKGKKRVDGDAGFDREWAALAHLAPSHVVPRLLGGDRKAWVLVIDELPVGRSLADSLLGDDPEQATTDLKAYATTLALLNSSPPFSDEGPQRLVAVDQGRAAFANNAAFDEALTALKHGRTGFVHGDACPDNVLIDETGTCYIFDFELATSGPIAMDAAYLIAPFPSCWCFAPLPPNVVTEAVAAYRSVLPLDQTQLDAAVVATAVSALTRLDDIRAADRPWGLTSMRPRILRWLEACEHQQTFPAAADAARRLSTRLHEEWGDASPPSYPAYAQRG
jgi:aminoglycoside phosphotransferase (APT) family kinase protein